MSYSTPIIITQSSGSARVCMPKLYLDEQSFLDFLERRKSDIKIIVHRRSGSVNMFVVFIRGLMIVCKGTEETFYALSRYSIPILNSKKYSPCHPIVYLDENTFLELVNRFAEDAFTARWIKGIFDKKYVYLAIIHNVLFVCITKDELPIRIDANAKKVSGLRL